jgi:Mg-chelatase subunit ChlD
MIDQPARLTRWRLLLGGGAADGTGANLSGLNARMDEALAALYGDRDDAGGDPTASKSASLEGSAPRVTRWLGDIREYFPSSVVTVMQRDAIERVGLRQMLANPEVLDALEPDIELVGQLLSLSGVLPDKTRATARAIVRRITDDLERKLASKLRAAIRGALDRSQKTRRPKLRDIDWNATVAKNLRHYQPEYSTVIPARLVGHGRRQSALRDIVIAVDQSGSMADSVVYSSVCSAVMASVRAVRTRLVVFDTSVVDLTDELSDPVDVLFSVQLGGGTDINRAVAYCQGRITRPTDTIFVLISDLFEGGVAEELLQRVQSLITSGVTVIVLLALSDRGRPSFDHDLAARIAALGAPAFACTPDQFPGLMAAAIERRSLHEWAATEQVALIPPHRAA